MISILTLTKWRQHTHYCENSNSYLWIWKDMLLLCCFLYTKYTAPILTVLFNLWMSTLVLASHAQNVSNQPNLSVWTKIKLKMRSDWSVNKKEQKLASCMPPNILMWYMQQVWLMLTSFFGGCRISIEFHKVFIMNVILPTGYHLHLIFYLMLYGIKW